MEDYITIPLSYLHYYHMESLQNPHLSTPERIHQQQIILEALERKGGIDEDEEVAMKSTDLDVFNLLL